MGPRSTGTSWNAPPKCQRKRSASPPPDKDKSKIVFVMPTAQISTVILPVAPHGAFHNEPFIDFSDSANVHAMQTALTRVGDMLGHEYELIIGGERSRTAEKIESLNPARPAQVVGVHQKAGQEHAERAMRAALDAFASWQYVAVEERAALLLHTAALIRKRKFEFCAWLTYEVGKNWVEADADVAETIDFLEFYAREAVRLAETTTPIQLPGGGERLLQTPVGVYTVILNPSSESPTIAARFLEVLEEAGMPPGVVNFCPGSGSTFGNAIVEHPKTRLIAFTGSKEVGLDIHARAAQTKKGQIWIKRTILEMGGKDSIIVSSDCDLDAAVQGVVASAFGFSGQKCSACSRALFEDPIYDVFVERVRERVQELQGGDPATNASMGPVVNRSAMDTILSYIEIGKGEGRVLTGGHAVATPEGGYYVEPTVIADVAPTARIAQEEIFGPVLAVIRARDYDHALHIANDTEYGLTGAVYSSSPEKLDHARRAFHVGNLYLNRKCTGAMVGAHPFGGFNMSGTDSKAGGPDYLLLFTQAKSIAEKI